MCCCFSHSPDKVKACPVQSLEAAGSSLHLLNMAWEVTLLLVRVHKQAPRLYNSKTRVETSNDPLDWEPKWACTLRVGLVPPSITSGMQTENNKCQLQASQALVGLKESSAVINLVTARSASTS